MLPGKVYGPEEILRIAWLRKWVILVPFVLISAATFVYARLLPDVYRSETLILVVPQRVPESYVRSTVTTGIQDRLRSISQQILSRTRLERIIHDFNLYSEARKTQIMEDIVARMRLNIDVETVRGDAFSVSFKGDDPTTVMKVTERLASMFIEENLRDREVQAEGTSQFLESQLENARQRLLEHERKLEEFRRTHAGRLPSQADSNLGVIQRTQMQVQSLVDSISRDRERQLVLERTLAEVTAQQSAATGAPAAVPPAAQPGDARITGQTAAQQLASAEQALQGLLLRLRPEHPDVIRMQRLVGELEAKAQAERLAAPPVSASSGGTGSIVAAPVPDGRISQLQMEIDNLARHIAHNEGERQRLQQVIAEYQARVEAAPGLETELTELMRDYNTLQQMYSSLLSKKEDSQIAANLERRQIGEQFKILDPARLPERPFSPNREKLYLMGALFALTFGLGLAALLEYQDATFRSEDDVVHALMLPVIATIPPMTNARQRRQRRRRLVVAAAAVIVVTVGAAGVAYWTFILN